MVHMHYNNMLMIGSVLVAVIACYIAISLRELLIRKVSRRDEKLILFGSGLFWGLAIWALHFWEMLAYHLLPGHAFDLDLSAASYLIAALASTFAVWLTSRPTLPVPRLVLGAVLMGLGIAGMHYTGMMGLTLNGYTVSYQPLLVISSVLIGISGSGLVFWLAYKYQRAVQRHPLFKLAVSILMVLAIAGMHYTAMTGAVLYIDNGYLRVLEHYQAGQDALLFTIILITCLVLVAAFLIAILEQRLEERSLQLLEVNKELASLAVQDNLTRLPNRLFLLDYAQNLFLKHRTEHGKFAFLYLDLDRFKAINDAFGHHVGDQLLIQVAARIRYYLGGNTKLLRIGGDEFLLIMEQTDQAQAERCAEKVLNLVQDSYLIAGKEINISGSIGIALYPEHGENLQDLLINADAAMLLSKEQGRNTYAVFNYSVHQLEAQSQSKLINDLYKAVEENQFILYYQPKFSTKNYTVCGVEALIRWQHPTLGLLSPNMFIEGAEKTGLIIPMGYWALEEACRQIQLWEQGGISFCPIAVNLSVLQFEHKKLFEVLEGLLHKYQIRPDNLIIEITESTAMHHIELSIRSFERLRKMGIRLAIDDFGTGHSSFLYLKDLPVDELKIDRGFIVGLKPGAKEEIILESIIQLATRLGLVVTAEGVESPMQAEILTRLGCQQLQGYLLGAPVEVGNLKVYTPSALL